MNDDQNFAGRRPIAIKSPRYYSRQYPLQTKDFTGAEKGVPIRLFYGHVKVAGVYMTPIFNFSAVPITQEIGK